MEMEKEEEELFVPRYVPVIFPPCTDIYFISKNIDSKSFRDDVREKLLGIMGRNLISMYDTCGFNPLLLIIDTKSPSKLDSLINSAREQEIDIHPTFISFTASPESIIKRFGMVVNQAVGREGDISDKIKGNPAVLDLLEYIITAKLEQLDSENSEEKRDALIEKEIRDVKNKDAEILIKESNINEPLEKVKDAQKYLDAEFIRYIHIEIPPVLGIIFLRFSIETSSDKIESVIDGFKEDPNVIDIYKIIGEYDYIIKVHQESISKLHSFCEKLYDVKIQTIMKCVLRMWKEEGWEPEKPIFPVDPPLELSQLQKDILRILCDERRGDILKEDVDEQIGRIRDLGLRTRSYTEVKDALKGVRKKVIYRTSVKLERRNWLKTMIFITAARGHKRELKADINAMLLGVDEKTFARKYYHVTGIVDFIVLLDCKDIYALRDKIGKFSKECGNKIRDIRIYFELERGEEQTEAFELTPRVLARINSLIPNSENFKETEYGTVNEENMEDYPTRYYCYEWEVKNRKEEIMNLGSADAQDKAVSSLPQVLVDLIPVSEIQPKVMIHAYVRFKFSKEKKFRDELDKIVKQKAGYYFLKKYDTIQDHTVVECIIVTKSFKSLFNFVKSLDRYCKLSEVNLIFHQEFFKPAIPEGLRCKPCRLPVEAPCDACEFYTEKRTMTTIRTRDFGIMTMKECKIAIVQIKIPETDPKTWIDKAKEDRNFKDKICGYIKDAIKKGANIIVFPELSIPNEFVDKEYLFSVNLKLEEDLNKPIIPEELRNKFGTEGISLPQNVTIVKKSSDNWVITDEEKNYDYIIRKEDKELNICVEGIKGVLEKESKAQKRREKIFVVAGSDYKGYEGQQDRNPYNVSPIILCENGKTETYEQQKNIQGDPERKIANAKGILRFSNTGFGDFAVLVCLDIVKKEIIDSLSNEIDILICPAWDKTYGRRNKTHRMTQEYIEGYIKQKSIFTVVANNGIYGGSGVYGPFAKNSNDAKKLEGLKIKKGEEGIEIYEIDIMDLDKNRGKGEDRDRRYLSMLNAKRRHEDKKEV